MPNDQSLEVEREIFMRSLSLVKPPKAVARQFARIVDDVSYPAGTRIYERGSAPDTIFFIISGAVELDAEDGTEPWVFDGDGVIGVIDALLDRSRSRSATALTPLRLLSIRSADYFELIEDNYEFGRQMFREVSKTTFEKNLELAPDGIWEPMTQFARAKAPPVDDCENLVERIIILQETEPFARMPTHAVALIAQDAERVPLSPGEAIVQGTDGVTSLWTVVRGEIELTHSPLRWTFGPCTLVGGSAAFADGPPMFGGRARTDSVMLRIDLENLFDVFEEQMRAQWAAMQHNALAREAMMRELQRRDRRTRATESLAS